MGAYDAAMMEIDRVKLAGAGSADPLLAAQRSMMLARVGLQTGDLSAAGTALRDVATGLAEAKLQLGDLEADVREFAELRLEGLQRAATALQAQCDIRGGRVEDAEEALAEVAAVVSGRAAFWHMARLEAKLSGAGDGAGQALEQSDLDQLLSLLTVSEQSLDLLPPDRIAAWELSEPGARDPYLDGWYRVAVSDPARHADAWSAIDREELRRAQAQFSWSWTADAKGMPDAVSRVLALRHVDDSGAVEPTHRERFSADYQEACDGLANSDARARRWLVPHGRDAAPGNLVGTQARLADCGGVALRFTMTGESLWVFVVTGTDSHALWLGLGADLDASIQAWRRSLGRAEESARAGRLTRLLLTPVIERLGEAASELRAVELLLPEALDGLPVESLFGGLQTTWAKTATYSRRSWCGGDAAGSSVKEGEPRREVTVDGGGTQLGASWSVAWTMALAVLSGSEVREPASRESTDGAEAATAKTLATEPALLSTSQAGELRELAVLHVAVPRVGAAWGDGLSGWFLGAGEASTEAPLWEQADGYLTLPDLMRLELQGSAVAIWQPVRSLAGTAGSPPNAGVQALFGAGARAVVLPVRAPRGKADREFAEELRAAMVQVIPEDALASVQRKFASSEDPERADFRTWTRFVCYRR